MMRVLSLVAVLALWASTVQATLRDKVYTKLSGNEGVNSCTRLINVTHEIGCTSPEDGAVGIFFKIESAGELDDFRSATESAYIVLLEQNMFAQSAVLRELGRMDKVKGAFVYKGANATRPNSTSTDSTLPNADYGLPMSGQTNWNPYGGGFAMDSLADSGTIGSHWVDFGSKAIYYLSDSDRDDVLARYAALNVAGKGKKPNYPVWGARLKNFMYGVRDTDLCLRRKHCDPLSGQNVWGSTRLVESDSEVILATAQMDAFSFFHDLSYGANSDASAVVSLIGAARLLGLEENYDVVANLQRNIVFNLFNGESFGYIGSSRLGFDLSRAPHWPSVDQSLSFENIKGYLELSQVLESDSLHAHAYKSNADTANIVAKLQAAAAGSSTTVVDDTASELPPASLRGFLNEWRDTTKQDAFPGVVVTAYDSTGFANKYHGSHLDDGIATSSTSDETKARLCDTAVLTAKTLVAMANDTDVASVSLPVDSADSAFCDFLQEMFDCVARNQTCELARKAIGQSGATADMPLSRYIGVTRSSTVLNRGVYFFFNMLSEALAKDKNVSLGVNATCAPNNKVNEFQTVDWTDGRCMNTTAYVSYIMSPAFESYYKLKSEGSNLTIHRDPRWSTWTESVWGAISADMFLMEDPAVQLGTLLGGLAYFGAAFVAVFVFLKYTDHDGDE